MDSILNFQEKYTESDTIKSYEYNEYQPTSGSNLNISGNINIHIENQDEFFHPRRSYLLVEGNLVPTSSSSSFDRGRDNGFHMAAPDVPVQHGCFQVLSLKICNPSDHIRVGEFSSPSPVFGTPEEK